MMDDSRKSSSERGFRPDPPAVFTPPNVVKPKVSSVPTTSVNSRPRLLPYFFALVAVGLVLCVFNGSKLSLSSTTAIGLNEVKSAHPANKVVVNLGMPRTGTHSLLAAVKDLLQIHNESTTIEHHHVFTKYHPDHLSEFLRFGKTSSPDNPFLQQFTFQNDTATPTVRILGDHPYFLLSPVAPDFPDHVYWIHVTRDIETHVDSFIYILEQFTWPRCQCGAPEAPYCEGVNPVMTQLDHLFFNRHGVLAKLCSTYDGKKPRRQRLNATLVPEIREMARTLLEEHTEMTRKFFQEEHPNLKYLHLNLEDSEEEKLKQMTDFFGLGTSTLYSAHYPSFNQKGKTLDHKWFQGKTDK